MLDYARCAPSLPLPLLAVDVVKMCLWGHSSSFMADVFVEALAVHTNTHRNAFESLRLPAPVTPFDHATGLLLAGTWHMAARFYDFTRHFP